jgi:hypothetical protein
MLLRWKQVGIVTYCGYILGFPGDTRESILRDIEVIKRELPVDLLEFFYLTPLPGSEDHRTLLKAGIAMDDDLNRYDLNHDVTTHPRMSRDEWRGVYRDAWKTYYTREHIETRLRRCIASGTSPGKTLFLITWFTGCIDIEGIHPLEGGFLRVRSRPNRRSSMRREDPLTFYPRDYLGTLWKQLRWMTLYLRLRLIYRRVRNDPDRHEYTDLALEPVTDHEQERDLFRSAAAQAYLEKVHAIEKLRGEPVQ